MTDLVDHRVEVIRKSSSAALDVALELEKEKQLVQKQEQKAKRLEEATMTAENEKDEQGQEIQWIDSSSEPSSKKTGRKSFLSKSPFRKSKPTAKTSTELSNRVVLLSTDDDPEAPPLALNTGKTSNVKSNEMKPSEIVLLQPAGEFTSGSQTNSPISTLGFGNTFEEKDLREAPETTRVVSLSSLNDFLDGDENDGDKDIPLHEAFGPILTNKKITSPLRMQNSQRNVAPGETKKSSPRDNSAFDDAVIVAIAAPNKRKSKKGKAPSKNEKERSPVQYIKPVLSGDVDDVSDYDSEVESVKAAVEMDFKLNQLKKTPEDLVFVSAPNFDARIMTSQSWDNLLFDDASLEDVLSRADQPGNPPELSRSSSWSIGGPNEESVHKQKKTKRKWKGLFRRKRAVDNDGLTERPTVSDPPVDKVSVVAIDDKLAADGDDNPADDSPEFGSHSFTSAQNYAVEDGNDDFLEDGKGDRYTLLHDDADSVNSEAKKRLKVKEPIVTDIDMMPEEPLPVGSLRIANSADPELDFEDDVKVEFAHIEVEGEDGKTEKEKTILERKAILDAIDQPLATSSSESSTPLERASTLQDGIQQVEPTESFLEMVDSERQKRVEKAEKTRLEEEEKKKARSFVGFLRRKNRKQPSGKK